MATVGFKAKVNNSWIDPVSGDFNGVNNGYIDYAPSLQGSVGGHGYLVRYNYGIYEDSDNYQLSYTGTSSWFFRSNNGDGQMSPISRNTRIDMARFEVAAWHEITNVEIHDFDSLTDFNSAYNFLRKNTASSISDALASFTPTGTMTSSSGSNFTLRAFNRNKELVVNTFTINLTNIEGETKDFSFTFGGKETLSFATTGSTVTVNSLSMVVSDYDNANYTYTLDVNDNEGGSGVPPLGATGSGLTYNKATGEFNLANLSSTQLFYNRGTTTEYFKIFTLRLTDSRLTALFPGQTLNMTIQLGIYYVSNKVFITTNNTLNANDPIVSSGTADTEVVLNTTTGSYLSANNINTYIENWWENEVKPELEAINTTLGLILTQMTPVVAEAQGNVLADQFAKIRAQLTPVSDEAQTENFADQLSRLRYLADPNATEVSNDKNHGSGIRVANPFSKIQQALLYDSLIEDGQILKNGNEEINDSSLSSFLNNRSNRNNSSTKSAATSALSALITQYENLSSTYLQYK